MKPIKYFLILIIVLSYQTSFAQLSSRLIGLADSMAYVAMISSDTNVYTYSGNRGSNMNTGVIQFDTCFNAQFGGPYNNYSKYIQTFDQNNNVLQYLEQDSTPQNSWYNFERDIYEYDANNNLISDFGQSGNQLINSYRDIYVYDNNNNLLQITDTLWDSNGNNQTPNAQARFSYNANNLKQSEIDLNWNTQTHRWDSSMWYIYTYLPNNQLSSTLEKAYLSTWVNEMKTTLTYDSNNHIINTLLQYTDTTFQNLVNYSLDSSVYRSGNKVLTFHQTWNVIDSTWEYSGKDSSAFDANGNILYAETSNWNKTTQTFTPFQLTTCSYNSFNQPLIKNYFVWDTSSGAWEMLNMPGTVWSHYYYETYNPVGVAKINPVHTEFNVYPSPATISLNVDIKSEEKRQAVIAIFDMKGRLLQQWNTGITDNYYKTIPVDHFSSGQYIIVFKNGSSSISRQVVIAH